MYALHLLVPSFYSLMHVYVAKYAPCAGRTEQEERDAHAQWENSQQHEHEQVLSCRNLIKKIQDREVLANTSANNTADELRANAQAADDERRATWAQRLSEWQRKVPFPFSIISCFLLILMNCIGKRGATVQERGHE
jgi:hypothetical protein